MTYTADNDNVTDLGGPPAGDRRSETGPVLTIAELVCAQAGRTPTAVAVESADDRLTYAELLARAGGLAHRLRGAGIRTGELVAVAVPRGVDLVVALVGVHLAGAAFVPLDPRHPRERLDYMLRDADVRALVTADATGGPEYAGPRICLDDVPGNSDVAGLPPADPAAPAYAIYTSGSTGRPKGVLVAHGALSNFVRWMRDQTPLGDADVVLPAVTTISFDIAIVELLVPLTTGGRVVVAQDAEAADPRRLSALLERTGARVMQATPTTWRMLLEAGWSPPSGFTVLCGGERLPADLADRLLGDGVVLYDLYGPTEATIWASATRYEPGAPTRFSLPPATSLHVLDEHLAAVGQGVEGELYIAGAGLATGYLGRPALTAGRFVAAPAAPGAEPAAPPLAAQPGSGARLYRTGDIARRHPDGRIEILGRADDQIKIRGFRVEPGEIEAVLATHPAVAEAAVRAFHDTEAPRLVGYVRAADPATPPDPGELRSLLTRTVPAYMVPVQLAVLPEFPRTGNGKLDRASLPEPEPEVTEAPGSAGADSGTEAQVAGVLAAVLGRTELGPHEDFFGTGGDSLLAIQAVNRLNAELKADLPINALFEARTVFGLTQLLDGEGGGSEPPLVPLDATTARLSSAQWRLWRHQQLAPDSAAYNESVVVRLPEPLDVPRLQAALTGLFGRHETLRTRYAPDASGVPVPVVLPAAEVSLAVEPGDPAAVLAAELARPFDLAAAPPVRVRLVRDATGYALLMVVHEIAADEASRALIADQVRAAYHGRTVTDPPLRYADYAGWQRDLVAGPSGARHLAFWRLALDGLDPATLRTDHPRTASRDWRAATVRFDIGPAAADGLREAAHAHGATMFVGLLTAFFSTLARHVDGTDVTVGVPVAGRDRPELEELVGALADTVVIRADVSARPGFGALLDYVREAVLAANDHAAATYEEIVMAGLEAAAATPDPARNPLFDTMFALHGVAEPAGFPLPDAPGARVDLYCRLTERTDGGLDGQLDYATQLFDESTVAGIAKDFTDLVAAGVSSLERTSQ